MTVKELFERLKPFLSSELLSNAPVVILDYDDAHLRILDKEASSVQISTYRDAFGVSDCVRIE